MPVTTSYPGIYIQELPSSAHTITAAPTSIAVFIGYVHPYRGNCAKKDTWGAAVQIFSFTEYEREFGGLFQSNVVPNDLPYAVQQFFLNGGSVAYVVGLKPTYDGAVLPNPTSAPGVIAGIVFKGLETLTSTWNAIKVTISNVDPTNAKTADITVSYGIRSESFRRVSLDPSNPNFIETRINGVSTLVEVEPPGGPAGSYTTFTAVSDGPLTYQTTVGPVLQRKDFTDAFADDGHLDKVDIFNLMVIPGVTDNDVLSQALAFCERKRAFFIMDPPVNAVAVAADDTSGLPTIQSIIDQNLLPKSQNGAIYFPYLAAVDGLTGKPTSLAPSGYVAGVYARTDNDRGVWKAPAGLETTIKNTTGVVPRGKLTDARAGVLNDKGVNAIRTFPDVGTVVFGARTLVAPNPAFQQWKYVPVRRTALFIEQTLLRNLGWAVFEPNDTPLWIAVTRSVERFMLSLFRQGAFQGTTPSEAFLVKCDSSTTTQDDIDKGVVNILVGFRPLKPAEFVIIQIAQLAGQVQA